MVLKCQNLNDSIVIHNGILSKILQKHASLVEKYIKTSKTPCWNLECQNARGCKRVFERAFRKNKSFKNKSKFYAACKQANKVHGIEREKYFKEKLANYKGNARATYNVVNQLLDKFSGNHPPITALHKHVNLLTILMLRLNKFILTCLTKIVIHLMLI